jgi:hypothetical protein
MYVGLYVGSGMEGNAHEETFRIADGGPGEALSLIFKDTMHVKVQGQGIKNRAAIWS